MLMRYLAGSVDLPYVTPKGEVITRPGWEPTTCLYLNLPPDYTLQMPMSPTAEQIGEALAVMMEPWRAYRFASPDAAAGMLSAVFAAISRPVMDLCPAYVIDAAVQGSGKTKAATALGALIEGRRPAVTAFAASNDDELRKRLLSEAVEGQRFTCIDNATGFVKSPTLAAVLTTGRLKDRILGKSQMVEANVRSLLTLTANNCAMDADLQRRSVQIRIDAGDAPTHRAFDFDPVTSALVNRRSIAAAVCVVLRAYFAAGAPDIVSGDAGGFADWNRLCRQPVLWLASEGMADALPWGSLADPATSMLADPADTDPEVEALRNLLRALWSLSRGDSFTSSDVGRWRDAGAHEPDGPLSAVRDALIDLTGKADQSATSLGKVLAYRRDRAAGGLRLINADAGGTKLWRVVLVAGERQRA